VGRPSQGAHANVGKGAGRPEPHLAIDAHVLRCDAVLREMDEAAEVGAELFEEEAQLARLLAGNRGTDFHEIRHKRRAVSTPGTSFTCRSTRPIASADPTCTVNRMKAWAPRERVLTAVTLMRSREIASEISRSSPCRSRATTSMSAENGASSPF